MTHHAESTERLEQWRSVLSRAFVPLEPSALPSGSGAVTGSLRATELDGLQIAEVGGGGQLVRRTAATIRAADPAHLKIGLQVSGRGLLEQDGREAELRTGDFVLYDTTRPYRLRFDFAFRMLVVMCPRTALDLPSGVLRHRTAVPVRAREGLGMVVSPFLSGLGQLLEADGGGLSPGLGGGHLGAAVLDSLAAAFAEEPKGRTASAGSLKARALAHIEAHLADPGLGPEAVAAALHVSVRYLQRAFEAEGETVAGWIRARRLERCRRDLRNPGLDSRPVSAVAARWGLVNAAHFSRSFRATYGVSPREYRHGASLR